MDSNEVPAPSVVAATLLVTGSISLAVSAAFFEGSWLSFVIVAGLVAPVAFQGLRRTVSRIHGRASPTLVRWGEAAGVGIVGVAAGLMLLYLGSRAWVLVSGGPASFADLLTQWDSGFYRSIVEGGYHREPIREGHMQGMANWAFFPLYPLIVRGVSHLSGLPTDLAGIATSVVLLTVACTFAYRYLVLTRSRSVALVGVVLLALGPYSFYAYTLYTESLFLCLAAVGFWALAGDRFLAAGVVGGLMSATRGVGVLFGIAMVVHLALRTDALEPVWGALASGRDRAVSGALLVPLRDPRVLSLALVPIGLFSYMAYLWIHVGDPLAFMTVQAAWGREFGNPVLTVLDALRASDPAHYQVAGDFGRYLGAVALLALALGLDLLWRGRTVEATFGLLLVLVPLASGINSIPRFVFGALVLFFAIADRLARTRVGRTVGLAAIVATNLPLVTLWFHHHHIVQ